MIMKKRNKYNSYTNILILVLAIVIISISVIYLIRFAVKPNTGLVINVPETISKDDKIFFAPKSVFSLGVSSGLLPYRDQILSINDKGINNSLDVIRADYSVNTFKTIKISILRDGTEKKDIFITPVLTLTKPDIYIAIIFILILVFTVFLIITKKSNEPSLRFIVFACLFYILFISVKPFYYENLFSNILIHFGKIAAWLLVFFAFYFPRPKFNEIFRRLFLFSIILLYIIFTIVRIFHLKQWFETGIEEHYLYYKFLGKIGNISDLIAYILYISLIFYSYIKTKLLNEKNKIEWLFAGFFLSIPFYFFFSQLPIIFSDNNYLLFSFDPFSNLFLVLFPIFLIIGLVKKNILILKTYVLNLIMHAVLLIFILYFFSLLYMPLINYLENNYGINERGSGFIVMYFLFISLFPIRYFLITFLRFISYKINNKSYKSIGTLIKQNKQLKLSLEDLRLNEKKNKTINKQNEINMILKNISNKILKPVKSINNKIGYFKNVVVRQLVAANNIVASDIKETINNIIYTSGVLREVTNDLREIMSIPIPAPIILNPNILIKNAVAKCSSDFNTVKINTNLCDNVKIKTEPNDLIDTLINIIRNAYEADIYSEIKIKSVMEDNKLYINICNDGPLIYSSHINKLFFPFFTTKDEHKGLGLYLSKILIERNNGFIFFDDTIKKVNFKIIFKTA